MIRQPGMIFRHQLAETLGMSVARMLEEVDSQEFSRWKAYDRLYPLDHARRAELSAGIIASLIHNSHVEKSYQAKAASHFMTDWGAEFRDVEEVTVSVEQKVDAVFGALEAWSKIEASRHGHR